MMGRQARLTCGNSPALDSVPGAWKLWFATLGHHTHCAKRSITDGYRWLGSGSRADQATRRGHGDQHDRHHRLRTPDGRYLPPETRLPEAFVELVPSSLPARPSASAVTAAGSRNAWQEVAKTVWDAIRSGQLPAACGFRRRERFPIGTACG
jgi:hypothetical protein